jgi:hypothetical protein
MKRIHTLSILLSINSIFLTVQSGVFEKYYSSYVSFCHFVVKDTLWLGTTNCLMKILTTEDKILSIYSKENSPINNRVTAIFVDQSNRVCVVIDDQRISTLTNDKWQTWNGNEITSSSVGGRLGFYNISVSDKGIIYCHEWSKNKIYAYQNNQWSTLFELAPNTNFRKFLRHPNGSIWWFNRPNGTNLVTATDTTAEIILANEIFDVAFSPDGTLYGIKYDGNLVNIKENGTTLVKAKLPDSNMDNPSIEVGRNGAVYVNQHEDLYVFQDKTIKRYTTDKFNYFSDYAKIIIDEKEIPWIHYGRDNRVFKFENGKFTEVKKGIYSGESVKANSNKSILWFNTFDFICGYNVITGEIRHFDIPPGTHPYVFAESDDPNQMWLGTSKGLLHFDGNNWNLKSDSFTKKTIYDLKRISSSQLIGLFSEGTSINLKLYDIKNNTWSNFYNGNSPLRIYRFYIDKTKKVWANLFDSLTYFEQGQWKYLSLSNSNMPNEKWIHLDFDSKNKLYAASNSKLYSYDGLKWELLDSAFCNANADLLIDSRDWIWGLNRCPGLSYYNGKNWIDFHTNNSNIPSINYNNIDEDANGDIWVSSNPAIKYKVNITQSKEVSQNLEDLIAYPNPANQIVTIDCPDNKGSLSIYNLLGMEVYKTNVSEYTNTISVEDLTPGLYNIVWRNSMHKLISKALFIK